MKNTTHIYALCIHFVAQFLALSVDRVVYDLIRKREIFLFLSHSLRAQREFLIEILQELAAFAQLVKQAAREGAAKVIPICLMPPRRFDS